MQITFAYILERNCAHDCRITFHVSGINDTPGRYIDIVRSLVRSQITDYRELFFAHVTTMRSIA